jgi:hypothetical protein
MADLSGNVPRAVTDLCGYIARRVADRSTSFLNLRATRQKTSGESHNQNNFHGETEHF